MPADRPAPDVVADVTDVVVRYATGIDTRDWPLLRSCFTDDCDADYGDIGHWQGADEITRWMADIHDPLGPTLHRITNVVVRTADANGDDAPDAPGGDQVVARCYVHGIVTTADGGTVVHAFGTYDDDLVRTPDGWRIARRRFTAVSVAVQTS